MTAPRDSRLPDGGGQQICGLYDIVPPKFGVATNNVVTHTDKLGVRRKKCSTASMSPSMRVSAAACS